MNIVLPPSPSLKVLHIVGAWGMASLKYLDLEISTPEISRCALAFGDHWGCWGSRGFSPSWNPPWLHFSDAVGRRGRKKRCFRDVAWLKAIVLSPGSARDGTSRGEDSECSRRFGGGQRYSRSLEPRF